MMDEGPGLPKHLGFEPYSKAEIAERKRLLLKRTPLFIEQILREEWARREALLRQFPDASELGHPQSTRVWLCQENIKLYEAVLEELTATKALATVPSHAPVKGTPNAPRERNVPGNPRAEIDRFLSKVLAETGRKITRKNLWTIAGYTNPTQFERFQRAARRASASAALNFKRVLAMKPEEFIRRLDERRKKK